MMGRIHTIVVCMARHLSPRATQTDTRNHAGDNSNLVLNVKCEWPISLYMVRFYQGVHLEAGNVTEVRLENHDF